MAEGLLCPCRHEQNEAVAHTLGSHAHILRPSPSFKHSQSRGRELTLLEELESSGKLTELEAARIFSQIIDALLHCHTKGVIHRDIRLENCVLVQSTSVGILGLYWRSSKQNNHNPFSSVGSSKSPCSSPCTHFRNLSHSSSPTVSRARPLRPTSTNSRRHFPVSPLSAPASPAHVTSSTHAASPARGLHGSPFASPSPRRESSLFFSPPSPSVPSLSRLPMSPLPRSTSLPPAAHFRHLSSSHSTASSFSNIPGSPYYSSASSPPPLASPSSSRSPLSAHFSRPYGFPMTPSSGGLSSIADSSPIECSLNRLPPSSPSRSEINVKGDLQVKLGGFSSALLLPPDQSEVAVLPPSHCKFPYLAWEIVSGKMYGRKADIWSAGVVLHFLLSGQLPFLNAPATAAAVGISSSVQLRFGEERWPWVSHAAKSLVRRMLDLSPSRRPTASEILADPWLVKHKGTAGGNVPTSAVPVSGPTPVHVTPAAVPRNLAGNVPQVVSECNIGVVREEVCVEFLEEMREAEGKAAEKGLGMTELREGGGGRGGGGESLGAENESKGNGMKGICSEGEEENACRRMPLRRLVEPTNQQAPGVENGQLDSKAAVLSGRRLKKSKGRRDIQSVARRALVLPWLPMWRG
eukprot:TRINITY_DN7843_c0_g1_i1.p1 TRINITY_DN7843_c0_g1~~TRINITY_DN7843_c0_g1_i1.p1  ORF type:complete len:635 (+),score=79.33 TRINITY_DN7843_c0_g1_i1:150-2054(+)